MSAEKKLFKVSGMSCAACSNRIEKSLGPMDGIENVEAIFSNNSVTVEFDPEVISVDDIKKALSKAGYPVAEKEVLDGGWNLNHIILSGIITAFLSVYAMGGMFGLQVPFHDDPKVYATIQLVLTVPVLWMGRRFYKKGFPALLHGSPTMDTLVSLSSGAAFVYSLYLTIGIYMGDVTSMHGICYDTAAMLVTLISVGKYLEFRSRVKADDTVSRLLKLIPEETNVIRDGQEVHIHVDQVVVGDVIIVRPGERIPADGTVIDGKTTVDESMLTGESMPVLKAQGSQVFTGTMNVDGAFKFTVDSVGENTMVSEIAQMLEEAKATKAPVARMADKVVMYFVPVVMTIAIGSCLLWWLSGRSVTFSLTVMISVLAISCPCALGLATPLAITVGSGKAAEHGILFRDAASLERSGRADSMIIDKTGTLTQGRPEVSAFEGDASVLPVVLAAESMSEHPIGGALVRYCETEKVSPAEITEFEYVIGKGVTCMHDGRKFTVGSAELFGETASFDDGYTHIIVSDGGAKAGEFLVSDQLRPDAVKTVAKLKEIGIDVTMVSGDGESSVKKTAAECGIEHYRAGALPADKMDAIKDLQMYNHNVMMVGDGINDSPALAQADVGIAMGSGTNIALGSSDVVLLNDELKSIPKTVEFGRATLKNIKENLFLALIYNSICIPIAAGLPYLFGMDEFLQMPMLAAAAMCLSSLCVTTNALRLRRFRPTSEDI